MSEKGIPSLSSMIRDSRLLVIRLEGDLDALGTRQINEAFSAATFDRRRQTVVDLSSVTYMSSSGLAMLVTQGRALQLGGGALYLAGPNEVVRRVFELSAFDTLFEIYASLEEAFTALET